MYIASSGLVCSVGTHSDAACAAMRAGLTSFEETPYLDTTGDLVLGSAVTSIPLDFENPERLVELLCASISDCLGDATTDKFSQMPLLLGLAEEGRPGSVGRLRDRIIANVEERLAVRFHPELSYTIARGHTSGFHALRMARALFSDPGVPACVVCGTDSYINSASLHWLERYWRLKTSENSDGVIPGEAAAAVLIVPRPPQRARCAVEISGIGFGTEDAHILGDEPLLGLGLSQAARAALEDAGIQLRDINFRLSDATGEGYGFKEHSLMLTRLLRDQLGELPIWHCADSIGDTGAAAAVCELVLAQDAFANGYAPGRRSACFASSVKGDRAVAVLTRQ